MRPTVTRAQLRAAVEAALKENKNPNIADFAGFLRLFAETAPRVLVGKFNHTGAEFDGARCPLAACKLSDDGVTVDFYSTFDTTMAWHIRRVGFVGEVGVID